MPTHPDAFALIAEALTEARALSEQQVNAFYRTTLARRWSEPARATIFDFVVACQTVPSAAELRALIGRVGTRPPQRAGGHAAGKAPAGGRRTGASAAKRPAWAHGGRGV